MFFDVKGEMAKMVDIHFCNLVVFVNSVVK